MSITISAAGPADVEAIAGLLAEMDGFYGAVTAGSMDERVRQIREALFAEPVAGYVLLARAEEGLAGLASYSLLWPAVGLTRSLFLKELYVVADYRGGRVSRSRGDNDTAPGKRPPCRHHCGRVIAGAKSQCPRAVGSRANRGVTRIGVLIGV